ncbi:hypothetical protein M427DRAFT_51590 [Gonapodya prolifera JEL478]|uniref:Nnf1-domain-containing protein n=1 Tax=Gonapodya prolifera (strain JEL478) TaxID=1344416 RepID=A0A139AXR2_GONPJ|nr:hypothetical protein M427DRAFT_51590 [Gonapodya prolifera JEL478]|eukprot:KXS21363.1 hypothetical protein M427DRAFT_51590 [Gonapodya prolifera JEL478]
MAALVVQPSPTAAVQLTFPDSQSHSLPPNSTPAPQAPSDMEITSHVERNPLLDRLLILRMAATKYLGGVEAVFNYQQLERAFPRLAEHSEENLRSAHEQINDFMKKQSLVQFEAILDKRNLPKKLEELLEMCEDAERRLHEGRETQGGSLKQSSISPKIATLAAVCPKKRAEIEILRARKAQIRLENESLMASVKERHSALKKREEIGRTLMKALDERDRTLPNASLKSTIELAEELAFGAPAAV